LMLLYTVLASLFFASSAKRVGLRQNGLERDCSAGGERTKALLIGFQYIVMALLWECALTL